MKKILTMKQDEKKIQETAERRKEVDILCSRSISFVVLCGELSRTDSR